MAVSKANISSCGKPRVTVASKWGKPLKGQGTGTEVNPQSWTGSLQYLTRPIKWAFLSHPSSPARRGSTSPPKYFGFAEVLHARQCSNAFDIALA